MAHLKKNKILEAGSKLVQKGLTKTISSFASFMGGPIGWILSFMTSHIVKLKLMPYIWKQEIILKAILEEIADRERFKAPSQAKHIDDYLKTRNKLSNRKDKQE